MMRVDEEFRWWRDPEGYTILKGRPDLPMPALDAAVTSDTPSLLSCIGSPDTIVPKSTPQRDMVPGEGLYIKFANVKAEDDVLAFCNQYGVPTDPNRLAIVRDDVLNDGILNKAQLFRQLIDAKRLKTLPTGINSISARIRVMLFVDDSGITKFRADSATLFDFMLYQAIQDFDREIVGKICDLCKRYYRAGPGADRNKGSLYCTDECYENAKGKRKKNRRRQSTENNSQPTAETPRPTGLHATHE
jgi:hypothetical protein